MLEYDTFYRPKYNPDQCAWPLIERMVEAGLEAHIAIATDMADAGLWSRLGDGPGLVGLVRQIVPRLASLGLSEGTIAKLVGKNITRRLARPTNHKASDMKEQ